jgi:hypothetical protein
VAYLGSVRDLARQAMVCSAVARDFHGLGRPNRGLPTSGVAILGEPRLAILQLLEQKLDTVFLLDCSEPIL